MAKIVIGIQGGKGSYNEVAIDSYVRSQELHEFNISYLYSTSKVLEALRNKEIDQGQFAISNSVGRYVVESLEAIAQHLTIGFGLNVVSQYEISVVHCLMAHSSSSIGEISYVVSHPQTYEQCKMNLESKYKHLKLIEGEGEYSDPAKVAEGIANGKFNKNTATLSNPDLASIYGLQVVSDELQDSTENITKFLLVELVN